MLGIVVDDAIIVGENIFRHQENHGEDALRGSIEGTREILTGGMVLGGWTNFHFFPSIEADFMAASLTMPQGTPVDRTSEAVQKLETGAERLRAR